MMPTMQFPKTITTERLVAKNRAYASSRFGGGIRWPRSQEEIAGGVTDLPALIPSASCAWVNCTSRQCASRSARRRWASSRPGSPRGGKTVPFT